MLNTKLIIIDGIPGSGKSTTGQRIKDRMDALGIPNRFYHEMEDNHPLRVYDKIYESLADPEEAEEFISKVERLFSRFVQDRNALEEVTIIESWLFQDTISFAYNTGMAHERILGFAASLQEILSEMKPVLIYYYQVEVERNWRWICEVRGPAFAHDRCGLYTDEDFKQAGIMWGSNQEFVHGIVQKWEIPKLIIKNENYLWDQYVRSVMNFLDI